MWGGKKKTWSIKLTWGGGGGGGVVELCALKVETPVLVSLALDFSPPPGSSYHWHQLTTQAEGMLPSAWFAQNKGGRT